MSFYENLERLMKEKNITGYQLHKDLNINPSTLNRWKNGSAPTIDKIPQLIKYFNTTADELIGIEETESIANENEPSTQFYNTLDAILKERKIKKAQLNRDLGITKNNLRSWREGCEPSAKFIKMLAKYLDVTSDELLGLTPRRPEAPNEQEAIILFRKLPEREQIKFIGKLEDAVNN